MVVASAVVGHFNNPVLDAIQVVGRFVVAVEASLVVDWVGPFEAGYILLTRICVLQEKKKLTG